MAFQSPSSPDVGAVFFDRREFNLLLRLYGQMVAQGEWRDYAIDANTDRALFSVFRRAHDQPLYQIEKRPALAQRQGAWSVTGQGGMILKRGHSLTAVLRLFDKTLLRVVE